MNDCYVKEFSATVTATDNNLIELDKTAFYPTGGGVMHDTGWLLRGSDEFLVMNVVKKDGRVWHEVAAVGLQVGDAVIGRLDWARRYKLMRMHTAAHLLSAVFYKEASLLITGNQIDTEVSRIDFNMETFDKDLIGSFVTKANQLIKQDAEVKIYFLDREEAMRIPAVVKLAGALPPNVPKLRIVEIAGIDLQADGGCHVSRISEIGEIVLQKLENKGKNNRRLYYVLT